MKGYYKMPAATVNAVDPQGWLHTGDVGTIDKEGYVRTSGRLKEMINKGGEVIYPTEIEEVLFSHPKVSNAQVFGVPNKATGEEVAAWIKLEEGATADRGGNPSALQGETSRFPPPPLHQICRRISNDPAGQDPEVQDKRDGRQRIWSGVAPSDFGSLLLSAIFLLTTSGEGWKIP